MDGDKLEDALKSLKIAKDALKSGDPMRVLEFIVKARRLDPSLPVDDLLQSIKSIPQSNRKNYTDKQVTIVRDIKRKKDYYEILGLERTCSVDDIRKSYRKLSLKVHPDKNNAPESEEAFKLVSNAFRCLSDVGNRRLYNLNRSDEPRLARAAATSWHGAAGYDVYMDLDTFFNIIYGERRMAPRTRTSHFRSFNFGHGMGVGTQQRHGRGGGSGSGGLELLKLLLFLLVILVLAAAEFWSQ